MGMSKEAFFDEVLENVRNISIRDLILDKYELQPGRCPFHNDRTPGSFSVVERRKQYKCWSCGASGDSINFVRETEHIGFHEAVFKIAMLYDIVDEKQVKKYYDGKGFYDGEAKLIRSYENLWKDDVEDHRADDEVIRNVLEVFARGESVIEGKDDKLSEAHRKHLMEERGLTEEEIEEMGYFTIPSRSSRYIKYFLQALEYEFGYDHNMLKGVPGFYKKKNDTSKRAFTFLSKKGIGIPVRNLNRDIQGIQIRKDVAKKGESRYIWLSSSFANDEEDLEFGTGSGSPIHVSIPKENKYPFLAFITEGIFKSEAIAKEYSAYALSIQGIQNWKNDLMNVIHEVEEHQDHPFANIMMMFDADIASNVHVFEATAEMINVLEELPVKIHFAWWDKDFGKGIDDVIQSGHQNQVKKISAELFVESYRTIIEELESQHGMKIRDILKDFGNGVLEEQFDERIKPLFYT